MVLPPNLTSGIRGPDGRNLTDLFNRLGSLIESVDGVAEQLDALNVKAAAIRAGLERLTGTGAQPAGFTGLPEYLLLALANPAGTNAFYPSLRDFALELRDGLNRQNGALFGSFTPSSADRFTQLLALLEQIEESTAATSGSTGSLSLVTGSLLASPEGSTIKDLLRSIDVNQARAADCCEAANPPAPPPVNNPPVEACSGYPYGPVRVNRFGNGNAPVNVGGTGYSRVLDFRDMEEESGGNILTDGSSGEPSFDYLVLYTSTSYEYCLSWNLTGDIQPQTARVVRFGQGDFYSGLGSGNVFNLQSATGQYVFTISGFVRFAIVLDYDGETPVPGLNFWLSGRAQP